MPPRVAYLGSDQPEAGFMLAQLGAGQAPAVRADGTPNNQALREAGEEVPDVTEGTQWEEMMRARGHKDFRFPTSEELKTLNPQEAQGLIDWMGQGAATDGEFESLRELAERLGLPDPYPDPPDEEPVDPGIGAILPGHTNRVKQLLREQGVSPEQINEMFRPGGGNREFTEGVFGKLQKLPAQRPGDLEAITSIGRSLGVKTYGRNPQPPMQFVPGAR